MEALNLNNQEKILHIRESLVFLLDEAKISNLYISDNLEDLIDIIDIFLCSNTRPERNNNAVRNFLLLLDSLDNQSQRSLVKVIHDIVFLSDKIKC